MSEPSLPQEILILTGPAAPAAGQYDDMEPRRWPGAAPKTPNLTPVQITSLQEQVAVFIQQLDVVMQKAPEDVGAFKMAEFEVAVEIVVGASGGVSLALLANAQASGELTASMKFVFRRS
jgi:hypothetical protein